MRVPVGTYFLITVLLLDVNNIQGNISFLDNKESSMYENTFKAKTLNKIKTQQRNALP